MFVQSEIVPANLATHIAYLPFLTMDVHHVHVNVVLQPEALIADVTAVIVLLELYIWKKGK